MRPIRCEELSNVAEVHRWLDSEGVDEAFLPHHVSCRYGRSTAGPILQHALRLPTWHAASDLQQNSEAARVEPGEVMRYDSERCVGRIGNVVQLMPPVLSMC
eukprot:GHVS01022561.1.p5 GENE.GHVS01022561.1~~GHVS01022561.1.p5  ORF type:complete len:102 (+),score=11.23 GHVS01022561.1:1470-1775(+)